MIKDKWIKQAISVACGTLLFASCTTPSGKSSSYIVPNGLDSDVEAYTTTADESQIFQQVAIKFDKEALSTPNTISLDATQRFQTMDGFGTAITGSACFNLLKMSQEDRTKFLKETFDPIEGMGNSYIRISIGCSDFSMDEYTWCDTPGLENFAIHELDRRDLFPILKEIQVINPNVKIMGSPWSPPTWMKVNNLTDLKPFDSWTSGQLNPAYYQDYATYFVKWIQAMEAEGFPIESITIQNEPLNRGNSASMFMTWQEQRDFIKSALGPKLREANIKSKLLIYDHNYDYDMFKEECKDQIGYPMHILADKDAAQYIDGSAWHAYGGNPVELDRVIAANSDKGIYFTEMSIGEWNYSFDGDLMWFTNEVSMGTINRNCKAVIVWNLMLDEQNGPDRPGGCTTCYGAVRINTDGYKYESIERLSHFYAIGHLSKVILPGAVRIASSSINLEGVRYTAFQNSDATFAMVLQNDTNIEETIAVSVDGKSFQYTLPAKCVTSLRWSN